MFTKETILKLVRHGLTFGGGILVGKGYFTAEQLAEFVTHSETIVGAAVTLVGLVMSIRNGRKAQ